MPRKYPAFVYWVSHILSPACACLCCYMPISAASDLLCVFFMEQVTDLFNIWRKKFELFTDDSLTSMEDSHQGQEIPKQIRLHFDFCCCLCPSKHQRFLIFFPCVPPNRQSSKEILCFLLFQVENPGLGPKLGSQVGRPRPSLCWGSMF